MFSPPPRKVYVKHTVRSQVHCVRIKLIQFLCRQEYDFLSRVNFNLIFIAFMFRVINEGAKREEKKITASFRKHFEKIIKTKFMYVYVQDVYQSILL